MSIQSQNVAGGFFESYAADAAVSLMFGVGYFLFQKFKPHKKENLKSPPEKEINLNFLKGKEQDTISKWQNAKTVEECINFIQSDYDGVEDPFEIISLMNRRGIMPDIETYNSLLFKCFLSANYEGVDSLKMEIFDYMGPVHANVSTLNILIKGLGIKHEKTLNQNNFLKIEEKYEIFKKFDEELMELIQNMEQKMIYMDVNCSNSILEALVKMYRLNDAWNQYFNMKKLFNPNSETFQIILKGLKESFESNEYNLYKVFEIVDAANSIFELDKETFHWLIENCIKFNYIDKVDEFFTKRKEKNLEILENTYGTIIEAYGRIFELNKAYELFEQIKSEKDSKNLVSNHLYCNIITACVRSGNILLAENIIEEMTLNNIHKDLTIYTTMIVGYKNAKFFNRAIELYDYIMANKLNQKNFDIQFYNTIMECCVEGRKFEKMEEIYTYIATQKYPEVNLETYLVLIKGYTMNFSSEKVTEIFEIITNCFNYGCKLDNKTYELILEFYARKNDGIKLFKIFSEMKSKNINLSMITYDTMIKHYCNRGNFNKAYELFEECVKSGYKPKILIYKALIELQISSGLIDRAITLFRNMMLNQLKPDQILFITMIQACYEYFREKEAAEFIVIAAKEGIQIDNSLYCKLNESIGIDNEDFKIAEKYEILYNLLSYLQKSEISLEESTMRKISNFIGMYQQKYLNKNKHCKYINNDTKENKYFECEEISIYAYAENCLYNNKEINKSVLANCYSNYNKQRHIGKYYYKRSNYNSNYEEEKSIYS